MYSTAVQFCLLNRDSAEQKASPSTPELHSHGTHETIQKKCKLRLSPDSDIFSIAANDMSGPIT